jgi:broad specificity phosphatase PhoE
MTQTIWLVRHAHRWDFFQPEWFNTATYPYDPPLSPEGQKQAISISNLLRQEPIQRIFTSPFLRTIQTAVPLSEVLGLPLQLEWGLCEWLCEDWTSSFPLTTPIDELLKSYPAIDGNYHSQFIPRYPEKPIDLDDRIQIIAEIIVHNNLTNSLIIGHKGSVLGMVSALTGNDRWKSLDLPCAGIIQLAKPQDTWEIVKTTPPVVLTS